jgi:hypothetical protein
MGINWFNKKEEPSIETALNDGTPVTVVGINKKGDVYVINEITEQIQMVSKNDLIVLFSQWVRLRLMPRNKS